MSSRDKILAAIRRSKPGGHRLPEIPSFAPPPLERLQAFRLSSEGGGADVVLLAEGMPLAAAITERFPDAEVVYSTVAGVDSRHIPDSDDPHDLAAVDVAVLPGLLGVAENGAVWVTERELGRRVSAFIAQHLVLVLPADAVVWNMHEAYGRLSIGETGFGVFIAGPSKTADIEQSLVIGAQGARSLTVVVRQTGGL